MEKTINQVFRNRAAKYNTRLAIEKKISGIWHGATWKEYYATSKCFGGALCALGIQKGDRVCILSENRLEWLYTDMGSLGVGACVVPIYPTLTADEVRYIVENSEARVLVLENKDQLNKAMLFLDALSHLQQVVIIDDSGLDLSHPKVTSFANFLKQGTYHLENQPTLFEKLADQVSTDDLATIVYTSGTTGVPKGAMITHGNIMAVIHSLDSIRPRFATDRDNTVPFLPLSHVFERAAGHFYGMYVGITSSYAESIYTIQQDFLERRPTMILAVPRVCEKVYQKIKLQVENQPAWKKKVFFWGHDVGLKVSALREKKQPIPLGLRLKYKLAYLLIFKKLRQVLGGRVRWMTASGGPTPRDIILFFNAAGLTVIEGYGMTECFAPASMSSLTDYKIGMAGKPLPGIEIRIASDGEILIRGDNVFKGYWKMEEETKASFTADGFLKSGDIGELDEDGFLRITDRKKNILITSGGKNIAPQKIENLFLTDPVFSHFLVIGEKRKYLSALVTIDLEHAAYLAGQAGIKFTNAGELLDHPDFLAIIDKKVAEKNKQLARFETIKQYRIIKNDFTQETGELTPSLKLKRWVVEERYKDLIEGMYPD